MSNTITRQTSGDPFLDPTLGNITAAAAAAAYTDFANANNPNFVPPALESNGIRYDFLQRFTGFDDVIWGTGNEERYALLYQSVVQPNTYLIAFRGTSSRDDMLLDLESGALAAFTPATNPLHFPNNIYVGDGFNKIYATKKTGMSASLQQQLFNALGELKDAPNNVLVTGHSLGGALASLFTLDLAVTLPQVTITSITYASPRVGTSNWQTVYQQTYQLLDNTIRVRNSHDLVPKVPPSNWPFGFKDVGQLFPLDFTVGKDHLDAPDIILSWHSLANYTYVLERALVASPQVWAGEFPDQVHAGWSMVSNNPQAANPAPNSDLSIATENLQTVPANADLPQ